MAEHKWDTSYLYDSFLPDAFQIYLSEIVVDWIKHAFVTKFNNIEADSVYVKFFKNIYTAKKDCVVHCACVVTGGCVVSSEGDLQ